MNASLVESTRKFGNPNDPDRPKPPSPPLKKVLSLAKEDLPQLYLGLFLLLISSMCNLSLPAIAGRVVDVVSTHGKFAPPSPTDPTATSIKPVNDAESSGFFGGGSTDGQDELEKACLTLLFVAIIGGICSGGRGYIFSVCGERLAARLRKRLYASILSQETGFFDTSRTGELINRISADTQVIQSALTVNISMLVRGAFQAVIATSMILFVSWKLSLVSTARMSSCLTQQHCWLCTPD
jgi:ABC-type multidrug transport system fused ATPase/permease subunit